MKLKPTLLVFAGPNGSGKSTATVKYPIPKYYVNADEIERHLGCTQMEAAKTAEKTREYLLAHKESFAFETVLSRDRNINLIRRARECGYFVTMIFVTTKDPRINIQRVQERIAAGGNKVALDKIEPRYWRAMDNIKHVYRLCNWFTLWDNSAPRGEGEPVCLAEYSVDGLHLHPNDSWSEEDLKKLFGLT